MLFFAFLLYVQGLVEFGLPTLYLSEILTFKSSGKEECRLKESDKE